MSKSTLIIWLNVLACMSVLALASKYVLLPLGAKLYFEDEYKEAMFQCDNSMRAHLVAKHRVVSEPSENTIRALKAAELGLITCHDYDKLRKRLLTLGVSEHELARIGLEKIEESADAVRELVETHEFRY